MRILFYILLSSVSLIAVEPDKIPEIVNLKLDHRLVHTIYCHERNTGVTTVVFPSEISGIYAARVDVKFDEKKPNPFLLSFTPGSAYFTIKSLSATNAEGAVNVIYEKKVYVINLKTVKVGNSSVSFIRPKMPKTVSAGQKENTATSASLLLAMLDKAKAYHLIKKHYPYQLEDSSYDAPSTLMDYSTHQILLKEVIRFDQRDALYFHIQIKNKTLRSLRYNPKNFAVNIGDKIFYAALTDASGEVPAEGATTAWFCITGTKAGGRNNLAVKNNWKVLLNVSQMPELITAKVKEESKPDPSPEEKIPGIRTLPDTELKEQKP